MPPHPRPTSDRNHHIRAALNLIRPDLSQRSILVRHPTGIITPVQASILIRPESSPPCILKPHPTGIIATVHPHPRPTSDRNQSHCASSILIRPDSSHPCILKPHPRRTGIIAPCILILIRLELSHHTSSSLILAEPASSPPCSAQSSSDPESSHPCILSLIRPESSPPCIPHPNPTRIVAPVHPQSSSDQTYRIRASSSLILVRPELSHPCILNPHPTAIIAQCILSPIRPESSPPCSAQSSSDRNPRTRVYSIFIRLESLHPCILKPYPHPTGINRHRVSLKLRPTGIIATVYPSSSSDPNQWHHASSASSEPIHATHSRNTRIIGVLHFLLLCLRYPTKVKSCSQNAAFAPRATNFRGNVCLR
jgi:hypothetical protein